MKRVPFVQQFYTTECGACVVTSLLNYYKALYHLKDVRDVFRAGRDGISLKQLIEILRHYNFEVNAYRIELLDWKVDVDLPAIVTWEENHYVILEKLTSKYAYITDSKIGNLKIEYKEFAAKFSGIIIMLHPNKDFEQIKKDNKVVWNTFKTLGIKYKYNLMLIFVLSIFSYVITLMTPIEMQKIIDGLLEDKIVSWNIILLFALLVLSSVVGYFKSYLNSITGVFFDRDVNKNIISKILNVPYYFFDKFNNSDVLFALDNVGSVKNVFLNDLISMLFETGLTAIVLTYLMLKNFYIFVLVVLIMIPSIFLLYCSETPIMFQNRKMLLELSVLRGFQVELVNSILGIKTSSLENEIYIQWKSKYKGYYESSKKYYIKYNAFKAILYTMITLSPILILVLSFFISKNNLWSVGNALSLYALIDVLFGSVYSVLLAVRSYKGNIISVERLVDILEFENQENTDCKKKIILNGSIKAENICFKYSNEGKNILKNIKFEVKEGEKLAIVGVSGSGKSTLLKVLAGLYQVNSGHIYYNNINIEELDLKKLKKQIAYISGDNCLMSKSIYDNITLGIQSVSKNDVEKACKIVNVHNEIQEMPMRYNTIVSEMGKNLSNGQRQRIALARIILLKPKIIFLDEAMSALDINSEKNILNYFYNVKCTVIMISHRVSLLSECNTIIVLENGNIVERGSYDDLLTNGSIFNKLL